MGHTEPADGAPKLLGPTTAYPATPTPARAPRCRLARAGGSGQHWTDEVTCQLRRRLRVASLLLLAGFAVFLVRRFFEADELEIGGGRLGLHTAVVAVLAVATAILWSPRLLCYYTLRLLETAVFGAAALYFAWIQYLNFRCLLLDGVTPGQQAQVLHLAAAASGLRWFMLMVVYGVYIPNSGRRCGLIVTGMALLGLLTTFTAFLVTPGLGWPQLAVALPDLTIILGLGVAVAVFGSYRLHAVQREAFEAKKLGQYVLKEKLGAGGMGEVYLAEHVLLRRPCAIKLIRPDQAGDPTSLSRFEREVRTTARLTHWNTVEIYDYGHAEDGTFYYVMEYLPGLSLDDLVEKHGPLAPARAVHLLRQACAGLREAHAIGLIHRDIKPSNLVACERGGVRDVVKVLDFGLVHCLRLGKEANKLTVQGTILGSPPFMAPEQAMGKSDLDARTDIYSLGTVAYFLLTGQPPFPRETAMQMLLAHAYEQPAPLSTLRPEVPPDLDAVVLRCLDKDPAKRFADVAQLDRALAACECAGDWTEDRAVAWWQEHSGEARLSVPADTAEDEIVATRRVSVA